MIGIVFTSLIILLRLSIAAPFLLRYYNRTELLQVYYISFTSANTETRTNSNYSFTQQNLSIVSSVDDSPFESLTLPFKIVLFGYKTERLYVNANGALHSSYVQPCPKYNIFGTSIHTFNETYYGVVAGFLTDFNAGNSSGNITATIADSNEGALNYVSVNFEKLKYYGTSKENTFRIVLYEDSSLAFKYDIVYRDNNFPDTWILGLRPPFDRNLTYIDSTQASFGLSEWGTHVTGIYAPRSTALNQQQFNMCPISRSWCVSPSEIIASQSAATLTITTLLLSCTDLLDYGIVLSFFQPSPGNVIAGNNQYLIKCSAIPVTGHDTFSQLSCVVPSTLTNQELEYFVIPVWRVKTTSASASYTVLPVASMTIRFVSGTAQADQCYYNSQTYGYPPAVCSNCEVCNFNTTCLDLPCTPQTPVLYEWPSCKGTCATNVSDNSTYLVDPSNKCCSLEEMDCGGICHGTQSVGVTDGSLICCAEGTAVDCAGICGGNTPVDACGECRGPDYTGVTCFAFDRVHITTGLPNNTFNAVFDASLSGAPVTFYVNLTNESNATVVFDFSCDAPYAPVITLPPRHVLKINESVFNIPIVVSLSSLFQGNQSMWAAKSISVIYYRQVYTAKTYSVDIPVHPSVTGCASITENAVVSPRYTAGATEAGLCLRLPGCMYCLTNANVRILRGSDDNRDNEAKTSIGRRLFNYLLPHAARNNDAHLLDGYCTNGWSADVCSQDMATLGNSGVRLQVYQYWFHCMLFIVLILLI